jgi:hypothetical protein
MEREIPQETLETRETLSRRFVIGIMLARGDSVATAEPAALQTGQTCEDVGPEIRSAQKWNCAARKTTASSNAKKRNRELSGCMCLLRRSLGKNGCEVKELSAFIS